MRSTATSVRQEFSFPRCIFVPASCRRRQRRHQLRPGRCDDDAEASRFEFREQRRHVWPNRWARRGPKTLAATSAPPPAGTNRCVASRPTPWQHTRSQCLNSPTPSRPLTLFCRLWESVDTGRLVHRCPECAEELPYRLHRGAAVAGTAAAAATAAAAVAATAAEITAPTTEAIRLDAPAD